MVEYNKNYVKCVKAIYGYDCNKRQVRYSLKINLTNKNCSKKINVIMMNPSKASNTESDNTVNKIIEICCNAKFGEIQILNSIPYYESDSKNLDEKLFDEFVLKSNFRYIKDEIKDSPLLLATGKPSNKKVIEYINKIHSLLKCKNKRFYCFGIIKSGYTAHPSPRKRKTKNFKDNNAMIKSLKKDPVYRVKEKVKYTIVEI